MTNPIIHVALASLILVPASCWIARNFARGSRGSKLSAEPLVPPSQAVTPFTFSRLDHIVLRCRDVQAMLDFYVGVLGAEPVWVGRFGGCLSHLRIGSSLIDLQSYRSPEGRRFHAGGTGLPAGAPLPEMNAEAGTLDHFAINLKPFDPVAVSDYLRAQGCSPFAEGQRYGADGEGYSMYLRDPESNVVELKCGASENE